MNEVAPLIDHGGWRARLEAPTLAADIEALPANWRRTVLELSCGRPAHLEDGPWLETALRGAIGRDLLLRAGFLEVESARRLLYDHLAAVKPGLAVPPPLVPEIDVERRVMRLRITLFGAGDATRDAVRQALIRSAEHGIALNERGSYRPSIDILDGRWWRSESVTVPPAPGQVQLKFLTPLALNASGPVKANLENLVFALLDRISGLARWQGLRLDTDWSGWRDLAKGLDFDGTDLRPKEFKRQSSRQPGRLIPMRGLAGKIVINRPPARLMPLLALGESAHAGAHGAFGMGRYQLIIFP